MSVLLSLLVLLIAYIFFSVLRRIFTKEVLLVLRTRLNTLLRNKRVTTRADINRLESLVRAIYKLTSETHTKLSECQRILLYLEGEGMLRPKEYEYWIMARQHVIETLSEAIGDCEEYLKHGEIKVEIIVLLRGLKNTLNCCQTCANYQFDHVCLALTEFNKLYDILMRNSQASGNLGK